MAHAAGATENSVPLGEIPNGQPVSDNQPEEMATGWLAWLAQLLADRQWLALYEFRSSAEGSVEGPSVQKLGVWPKTTTLPASLATYAHRALVSQAPLHVTPKSVNKQSALELSAIPVKTESGISRVLCVAGPAGNNSRRLAMIRLCEWAVRQPAIVPHTSLEPDHALSVSAESLEGTDAVLAKAIIDALPHRSPAAIATALANEVVSLCGCERVSIGVHTAGRITLVAVSGQASVDKHRQLPQLIQNVMEEAVDKAPATQAIRFDSNLIADTVELTAHRALFNINNERPIATLKLRSSLDYELLAVLERSPTEPLLDPQLEAIQKALIPAAGFLELVDRAAASIIERVHRRFHAEKAAFKSKDTRFKRQIQCGTFFVLCCVGLFPVPHKVTGNVSIEAEDMQVIVAPQAGHIASAHARAGDTVEAGDLLATLDGHELQLEVDKWNVEKVKNNQAYAEALASHNRIELSRLRADAKRVDAELALVEQRLSRSQLRAPMSGVLLSGDVSQSLGAPVEIGEVLFEIGSALQHRMIIEIDERDVAYVQAQQAADIRMASFPNDVWAATVDTLQPVAVADTGASHFRLPATLDEDIDALRPGMEGVAKITVGSRSLIWVLTHKPVEKMRYWLWKLGLLQ